MHSAAELWYENNHCQIPYAAIPLYIRIAQLSLSGLQFVWYDPISAVTPCHLCVFPPYLNFSLPPSFISYIDEIMKLVFPTDHNSIDRGSTLQKVDKVVCTTTVSIYL